MFEARLGKVFSIGAIWLVVLMVSGVTHADGVPVYNQPATSPVQSVWASQNFVGSPLGLYYQTFDSFQLSQSADITGVQWQGAYVNTLVPDPNYFPPANSSAFEIEIFSDSGGAPGSLLASFSFSPSGAGETFAGDQSNFFGFGLSIYDYSASLGSGFEAAAGTQYWLSIFADSPLPTSTEGQWGWNNGTGGDGSSLQSVNGSLGVRDQDRAFDLTVPEPNSLLLLASGLAGFLGLVRQSRRSAG